MTADNPLSSFSTRAVDAARQNPVAAALIGAGVFYMLFGGKPVRMGATALATGARGVGSAATSLAEGASQATSAGYSSVVSGAMSAAAMALEAARAVADQGAQAGPGVQAVTDRVSQGFSDVASRASKATADAGTIAQRTSENLASNVRSALSEVWDRQPLTLGLLGLAIGAGVAASVPVSEAEKELLAGPLGKLRADAQSALAAQVAHVTSAVNALGEEAASQGLTAEAGKQIIGEVKDRLGEVAKAAVEGQNRPSPSAAGLL